MTKSRREKVGMEQLKSLKVFINCSQTSDDVHKDLEGYKLTKKTKVNNVW